MRLFLDTSVLVAALVAAHPQHGWALAWVQRILLLAADRANVDQIVTLNARDFRRVYPALADRIVGP